jgi:hypothetical protein
VLIADQVADYELQKLRSDRTDIRWQVHRASPQLLGAARQLRPDDWRPLMQVSRPEAGAPNRHTGPICTGDKVIANGLMDQYRDIWSKLIGVEMEAGGVASAAFQAAQAPGFFMVRGVSDLADPDKDAVSTDGWRAYACDVAASFVEAFLKSGPVVPIDELTAPPSPGHVARSDPARETTMTSAVSVWEERLEFLRCEQAKLSDPAQKFALHKQIEETEAMIETLRGQGN